MKRIKMNAFLTTFGSGPKGLVISVALFFLFYYLKETLGAPDIFSEQKSIRLSIFAALTVISIVLVIWSIRSLDPRLRGKTLITTGAFRYLRHPLYAAFLSVFNFGLAVFLNNWIYVLWALALHPVWHFLVKEEEKMLEGVFPRNYKEYCEKTGRFFPRLPAWKRQSHP